jgi:2-keto-4-pentenoate hydratase/2-oxohepta-3-ene-1,7-dioic acid hydratase in catechol pathway
MHYQFEDLIAYISRSETLYPGDFIGSGTCSSPGCRGCGLELGRFLKPGDLVELEVQDLGVLRNRIAR